MTEVLEEDLCSQLDSSYQSISTGAPDSPFQTDLGAGVEFGLTPTLPIKRRRRFEPNRNAGNPVPAPPRGAPIGGAGTSRHVGRRALAPPGSESLRRVALKTTREAARRRQC